MGSRYLLIAAMLASLAACGPNTPTENPPGQATAVPPDAHTSQTSLDWAGTYEGLLPCADCAGVVATLKLDADGTFALSTRRLGAGEATVSQVGKFGWSADGGSIQLAADTTPAAFQVGEGRLLALNADGSRPAPGSGTFLHLVPSDGTAPAQSLVDNSWTLQAATAADGSRLAALFPEGGRSHVLAFADGRLNATGGCNGLRASYTLTPAGELSVGGAASTLMACEPPLMAADAALTGVFSAPLQVVLARGPAPSLALIAATGEVLLFGGEPTHEARYGPATVVFYEVGPHRLPCEAATSPDGRCLQLREISFDAQGLRTGEPGEFAAFAGGIEGYEHVEGTRNVLRLKRFGAAATPGDGVMVLDLMVESEVMPK